MKGILTLVMSSLLIPSIAQAYGDHNDGVDPDLVKANWEFSLSSCLLARHADMYEDALSRELLQLAEVRQCLTEQAERILVLLRKKPSTDKAQLFVSLVDRIGVSFEKIGATEFEIFKLMRPIHLANAKRGFEWLLKPGNAGAFLEDSSYFELKYANAEFADIGLSHRDVVKLELEAGCTGPLDEALQVVERLKKNPNRTDLEKLAALYMHKDMSCRPFFMPHLIVGIVLDIEPGCSVYRGKRWLSRFFNESDLYDAIQYPGY